MHVTSLIGVSASFPQAACRLKPVIWERRHLAGMVLHPKRAGKMPALLDSRVPLRDTLTRRAAAAKRQRKAEQQQCNAESGHRAFVSPLRDRGHDKAHADEDGEDSEDD